MKIISFVLIALLTFASFAQGQNYQQPSLEEIRRRQAEAAGNATKALEDPFIKVMVEIVIPPNIKVFIDPIYGCQYFITVDDKGNVLTMVPRNRSNGTHLCERTQ